MEEKFIEELKALFEKYNAGIVAYSDPYDYLLGVNFLINQKPIPQEKVEGLVKYETKKNRVK